MVMVQPHLQISGTPEEIDSLKNFLEWGIGIEENDDDNDNNEEEEEEEN